MDNEELDYKKKERQELIEDIQNTYECVYQEELTEDLNDYEIYQLKDWLYRLTCKGLLMDERREYLKEHDFFDDEMEDDFYK